MLSMGGVDFESVDFCALPEWSYCPNEIRTDNFLDCLDCHWFRKQRELEGEVDKQ